LTEQRTLNFCCAIVVAALRRDQNNQAKLVRLHDDIDQRLAKAEDASAGFFLSITIATP
jgi:hypothetical protein